MKKILRSGSSLAQRQTTWILLTKFALVKQRHAAQKRANTDPTAKSVQLVWIAKCAQEMVIYKAALYFIPTENDQ